MLTIRLFSAVSRPGVKSRSRSNAELEQLVNEQIETAERIGLGEAISASPIDYHPQGESGTIIVMVCFKTKT
ncbi:MAG: hypothetical protein AAB374_02200 [Patescibacteria group bacterium]